MDYLTQASISFTSIYIIDILETLSDCPENLEAKAIINSVDVGCPEKGRDMLQKVCDTFHLKNIYDMHTPSILMKYVKQCLNSKNIGKSYIAIKDFHI